MSKEIEIKFKKLEFYQSIIARMNSSSMQIKVATYTVSAIILGSSLDPLVALLPIIMFWFLDSYYLANEKQFRNLYNDIADDESIPSLKIDKPFNNYCELICSVLKSCKSFVIVFSYIPVVVITIIFYFNK